MLFQYAIIFNPTKKEKEDGVQPKIVCEVKTILAADQNSATVLAARAVPQDYLDKLDRIQIVIRPF